MFHLGSSTKQSTLMGAHIHRLRSSLSSQLISIVIQLHYLYTVSQKTVKFLKTSISKIWIKVQVGVFLTHSVVTALRHFHVHQQSVDILSTLRHSQPTCAFQGRVLTWNDAEITASDLSYWPKTTVKCVPQHRRN